MKPTRALVITLVSMLLLALSPAADARRASRSLDRDIRRAVRLTVRMLKRRGRSSNEIRGAVQAMVLRRIAHHRLRSEQTAMRRAGVTAPTKELKAFVDREMNAALSSLQRPHGWDAMSGGRRFGVFVKALRAGFAKQRTFPSNFKNLDNTAKAEVARGFAAHAPIDKVVTEQGRWSRLLGVKADTSAKSARQPTGVEQLLAVKAGGSKPTPKRYYGDETIKAAKNFRITGKKVPFDMIRAYADIKAAAAIANMRTGRLDKTIGGAIVKAAREIRAGKFKDQFITDAIQGGAGTSVNMNVNEVIAARASELLTGRVGDTSVVHPIDHVNMAQSTNDTFPTAIRLTAYRRLGKLLASYELLIKELDGKAKAYAELPKPGRTHLQDAVPIMLGREFKAYAAVLKRDKRDIKRVMKDLLSVNMGATAVGTQLNAQPAYVKNVTKILAHISRVPVRKAKDLVDATQNVDALTRAHATLKVSSTNLIKVANDLRMMNSGPRAGYAEIQLPATQKGSSIMPGKVNPVIAEVVNQIGYQVQGNDITVNLVGQNGQFELNQMEPVLAHNLLQSIKILDAGARTFATRAIRGLKANDKNCLAGAKQMLGLATALTPKLGYDVAATIAKTALKQNKTLHQVAVEGGHLTAAEATRLLDPARMARGGVLK